MGHAADFHDPHVTPHVGKGALPKHHSFSFLFTISLHFSYYQLFQVTEPRVIIPPHESAFIRLWFAPSDPTSAEVLVFINNESEQNEECLLVRVRVG